MPPNSFRSLARQLRQLLPKTVLQRWHLNRVRRLAAARGLQIIQRDLFYDLKRADTVLRIRKNHAVYLQHMVESFDYYADSVIPVHADGIKLIDMSGPRFHRLKGFGDIPFLFPSHTEPFCTTAEYLDFAALKDGDTVIDMGAYAAVTSIAFALLVGPHGHVYALEADTTNYECGQINVEMATRVMGLANITLINKAIWSHSNGVLFSHEGAMGSSAVAITGGHRGLERVVPSIRLQDFLPEYDLDHVDFAKIDIEGGEVEMLKCSARSLKEVGARVIVEPHFVGGAMSTGECGTLLASAGYRVNVRQVGEVETLIEAKP